MALDKLALPAISDADVLDVLRMWEFQSKKDLCFCFVESLSTTVETQKLLNHSPERVSLYYSKKRSPGTVRYLGNCNQCCWTRRCYSCNTPAPSCLWSVCTLARGQHAAHVCTAIPIYHHHHDSRAPSVHSMFLLSNHECLMWGQHCTSSCFVLIRYAPRPHRDQQMTGASIIKCFGAYGGGASIY